MASLHSRLAPITNINHNASTTTAGAPILRKPEMTSTAAAVYASRKECATSSSHSASANKVLAASATTGSSRGEEVTGRRSGSKRDHETSITTDQNPQDATKAMPPPKKKVTYTLPHQNMEEGHFYVVLGEDIDVSTQRFKILSLLGEGTFGKVVESWDRKRKEYCAVKIVRNVPKYTRDAKIEIQFMEKVRQADPADRFR
ncbi:kinetoplastid kinetochore protein 19, putative [Leishmania tarentolae]|uniref:Kinetoplastid kinetochore protein 19, putative n=1 Tax=Leishmania tarentolae TaxID=5689 RepID=A0A640KB91_LEITA|nr:kinetoplastid kinetochore protein 19, putative [Leishmania tarentolae]